MSEVDLDRLAQMVRERRGERSLRQVAAETGISHSTLSRVENGDAPDIRTFARLCLWLQINPASFFGPLEEGRAPEPPVQIRLVATSRAALESVAEDLSELYGDEAAFGHPMTARNGWRIYGAIRRQGNRREK